MSHKNIITPDSGVAIKRVGNILNRHIKCNYNMNSELICRYIKERDKVEMCSNTEK